MSATFRFSAEAYADLVGRPFEFGAYGPSGPIGCWGLVVEVMRRAGVDAGDPETRTPARSYPTLHHAGIARCAEILSDETQWEEVPGPARPGDVALFGVGGAVEHAGVILDGGLLLHAVKSAGVVCVPAARMAGSLLGLVRHRRLPREQAP